MTAQQNDFNEDAALVIIGAGWSGVTALTVARHYINKPEKIVIADVRSNYGGQWIDAYDFVHLHQPYQTYTSYDQSWTLDKPPEYLASRDEVLAHLQDMGQRAGANELFGYRYIGHEKVEGNDDLLEVSFEAVPNQDNTEINNHGKDYGNSKFESNGSVKIRTKRLIHCHPVSHQINSPFQLSSLKIKSIDIRELHTDIADNNGEQNSHYVIVGSGKSAMDATNYIHDTCNLEKTKVSMIAGNGIAFLARDQLFPPSWYGRNFGGTDIVSILVDYALKWDGTNQASLMREMERNGLLISAVSNASSCLYGLLSHEELEKVNRCVGEIVKGRMSDIVDSVDGTGIDVVLAKSGERVPLKLFQPGLRTVVVNCTELTVQENHARPVLQDEGRTLVTQLITISPGVSVTNLVHAWFLGILEGNNSMLDKLIPMEFPIGEHKKDRLFFKSALIGLHNFGVLIENMPVNVMRKDNTNPLSWFPLWRQVRAMSKITFAMPHTKEKCHNLFGDLKFPVR